MEWSKGKCKRLQFLVGQHGSKQSQVISVPIREPGRRACQKQLRTWEFNNEVLAQTVRRTFTNLRDPHGSSLIQGYCSPQETIQSKIISYFG